MNPGRDTEFAEFVDGRFTALQRFGYLLTGEWHLAEDLVQPSLTKVWFHRNGAKTRKTGQETYTAETHTYTKPGTYTFRYTVRYCSITDTVRTIKLVIK
ncbi:hypothetical protein AB0I34_08540 [Kribbella sp. NPDC050281]|uniref:hypothetical protein n=1 Tax=Kribbella sp. NPDC050281 TaxID=3155515 RepID=UPI0033F4C83B